MRFLITVIDRYVGFVGGVDVVDDPQFPHPCLVRNPNMVDVKAVSMRRGPHVASRAPSRGLRPRGPVDSLPSWGPRHVKYLFHYDGLYCDLYVKQYELAQRTYGSLESG